MTEVIYFGEPLIGLFVKDNQEELSILNMDIGGDVIKMLHLSFQSLDIPLSL